MYIHTIHTFACVLCAVKCRCSLSDEPVKTICIGPSIPPCDCSQTSCEVNNFIHMYYTNLHLLCVSVIHLMLAIMDFVGWILIVMAVLM